MTSLEQKHLREFEPYSTPAMIKTKKGLAWMEGGRFTFGGQMLLGETYYTPACFGGNLERLPVGGRKINGSKISEVYPSSLEKARKEI